MSLRAGASRSKAQQGNATALMAYAAEDTHPLVAALVKRLSALPTELTSMLPRRSTSQRRFSALHALWSEAWSRHHRHLLPPSMGSRREGIRRQRCRQP